MMQAMYKYKHAILYEHEHGYCLYLPHITMLLGPIDFIGQLIEYQVYYDVRTLWIMPSCGLSYNVSWQWIDDYSRSLYNIFPDAPLTGARERKPTYMRVRKAMGKEHFLAFPGHEEWVASGKTWVCDTPKQLLDTVDYIEEEYPLFGWSPQNIGRRYLQNILLTKNVAIQETILTDKLKEAISQSVYRPTWCNASVAPTVGQRATGGDKNGQFVGGTRQTVLGNGQYYLASPDTFDGRKCGLWLVRVDDVSESIFDSYQCFCPFTSHKIYMSTDLVNACRDCGIGCTVLSGLVWEECAMYMDLWGKRVWDRRAAYYDEKRFPNEIARANAQGTAKQIGNSFIGLLATPQKVSGKGMIYRPDWNTLIIHKAIANLMYSILARYKKYGVLPVIIARGDTMWYVSDEPTIPTFFDHVKEQRGWKPIGETVIVDSHVVDMFSIKCGKGIKENEKKAGMLAEYLEQRAR